MYYADGKNVMFLGLQGPSFDSEEPSRAAARTKAKIKRTEYFAEEPSPDRYFDMAVLWLAIFIGSEPIATMIVTLTPFIVGIIAMVEMAIRAPLLLGAMISAFVLYRTWIQIKSWRN